MTTKADISGTVARDALLARFSAWLADPAACGRDYSPSTVKKYVSAMRVLHRILTEELGGAPDLEKLVPRDLVLARQHVIDSGRAGTVANVIISAGKAWARALGKESEFAPVRMVSLGWKPRRALSKIEYNRLLRALEGGAISTGRGNLMDTALRDLALFALLLGCALRAKEATRVTVTDVTLGPKSGYVRVRAGKGMKERSVPVAETFRPWLRSRVPELWEGLDEGEVKAATLLGRGGRGGDAGKPCSLSNVRRVVLAWGKKAGISDIHPHMLRRTRAQVWREEKGLEATQLLLGHANVNTTVRYTAKLEEGEGAS